MNQIQGLMAGLGLAAVAFTSNAATFVGDRTDFRDETIYFAMTTRFYDGDPTNNVCSWDKQDVQKSKNDPDWRGDFAGLIEKLDYIKALGFTAIWITPVVQNASGEDYHGYHAMDFSNVDLRYESRKSWGASEDVKFKDLIKAAHDKGLKIVLDIVLQHTGNFGEVNLNPLFTRSQEIRNQASVSASMIPNPDRLSSNYFDQLPEAQYAERWKYFKNPQYEPNNYYHHYGTGWNWDLPNRWWGQIAGDCVDLNTENDHVAQYIVDCYGEFIKLGVDAFRIDTSGHISPVTFNKQFIPQFMALGEQYKKERLNECPFYMFGEVCQRFQGSVVYRDQPNLSSYFYTWKSDQALLDQFNGDPEWWASQVLPEGHDTPVGPMAICEKDTQDKPRSENAWMKNGRWHEPDYSQASGFNVIDFPFHYSFSSVGNIIGLASQDNYYNDASYNVVYVDSHDYGPGPNDGTRFNGGTAQWAENLAFMFTFRGIPCIYYGSEVEFKAGLPIDVGGENNKTPRSESGRAYFGTYLEGNVTTTDFCEYTADGNVAKTLNGDLSQHIRRLNQIRAAVPALRKGQYTFDGCKANGGWAFKRAYKNDSFACVAVNGGGTFSNLPAGTYTELVTGQQYTVAEGGSLTLSAPTNKGQVRVAVKGWTGGKVGTDGKFIYANSAVSHGGAVSFADPGTTQYYTSEDAIGRPSVKLSPDGGTFKTETLTVTATLNDGAVSGWYKVGNDQKKTLAPGASASFTIGQDMEFNQSVSVTWGASDGTTEYTGNATYKKVDPNATITVYVEAPDGSNIYAWDDNGKLFGDWPGKALTGSTVAIDGHNFYSVTVDDSDNFNIIFNRGGNQTADITGVTEDVYYSYDGGSTATKLDIQAGPKAPSISATPGNNTSFTESLSVTLSVSGADNVYYTLDGSTPSKNSTRYTTPITISETTTIKAYAENEVGSTVREFTYTKRNADDPYEYTVYFDNSASNWGDVYAYCWDDNHAEANSFSGAWPGKKLTTSTIEGKSYYVFSFTHVGDLKNPKIIFNNGGSQTDDFDFENLGIYNVSGKQGSLSTVINVIENEGAVEEYYNLQGIRVMNPTHGIYVVRKGSKTYKVMVD